MMHSRPALGGMVAAVLTVGLLLPTQAAVGATACVFNDDATTKIRGLTGDCDLTATLAVADGWTIDGNGHTITADASGGFTGPIIESQAGSAGQAPTTMNVAHLNLQAVGFSNATGRVVGILFDGAKGLVSDVGVSGVSQGTTGDNGYGVEVDNSVGAAFATTDQVKIDHGTTISGYQRAAVYVHGNVKFTVLRATIGSPDAIAGQAVAGILATTGAHGAVKENQVSLSDTDPASASSFGAGVQIVETRRVEVRRNLFTGTDADFGVSVSNPSQLAKTTAVIDCNLIRRNDSSATDTYGVAVARWQDASLTNVLLTNATLEGNWRFTSGTVSGTTVTGGPANVHDGSCPPTAPTDVFAAGGDHRSKVTWGAAVAPDYAPLTGYRVTAKAAGHPGISTTVGPNATSAVLTGLNNNRTYVVTVSARSNGGQASGTDQLYKTTMTLTAKPGTIHRGASSTLHGRLSSGDPQAVLAKRKVAIWAKPRGGSWTKIDTVRTTSTGAFSRTVSPRKRTTYKAVYPGHPDLASLHRTTVVVKR